MFKKRRKGGQMKAYSNIKFAVLISTSVMCWFLVLGMIVYAYAATVELTWNANTEVDLAGYSVILGERGTNHE